MTVCRVDDGSLAALGGLRVNDELLTVDGQNVERAASETAAALVKYVQAVLNSDRRLRRYFTRVLFANLSLKGFLLLL